MKNLLKIIGILALITVLGFSMITCKAEEEESAAGELIIGFFTPDYNNKYVKAEGIVPGDPAVPTPDILIIAADSYTVGKSAKLGFLQNNAVKLSVWNVNGDGFVGDTATAIDITVYVYAAASDADPEFMETVTAIATFTGGKATVDISGALPLTAYVAP